jgi:hypothetical protein
LPQKGLQCLAEICVVFELKTSRMLAEHGLDHFSPSTQIEFVSANCLSYQPAILAILTDLSTITRAWRSAYDPSLGYIVVHEYSSLTTDEMLHLVCHHLQETAVRHPAYVPQSASDINGERYRSMKRKFNDAAFSDALAQFEVSAEGTKEWSRDRAVATWDFLRNMGVDRMPAVVQYQMYS